MKPLCFYHKSDLDGVCSAAIVKHFVPDCELFGMEYGDEFPWHLVQPSGIVCHGSDPSGMPDSVEWKNRRTVYLVDFSLKPEDMKRLAEVSNLIWIDHHQICVDMGELTK